VTTPAVSVGPSAPLDVALALARRLAGEAIRYEGRCAWLGDDMDEDGVVVHRSTGADLYGGTSGIGWFLAAVASATGDELVADAARGAVLHALDRSGEADGDGLYTGRTGVALAAVAAGRALADEDLVERGADLGSVAARSVLRTPPADPELMSGAAGTALGLLELGRAVDDELLGRAAVTLGGEIVDWVERALALPVRSAPGSSGEVLCGLGHGASGPALALLELEAATTERAFGEAARTALAFERAWFSREHCGWPDLRGLDRARVDAGSRATYSIAWCHGAVGIGLVRLRAFDLTGDPRLLAEAAAAIDSATIGALSAAGSRSRSADLSLCHGVGAVAELHLLAAEVTGDVEHLEHALRIWEWSLGGRGNERPALPEAVPCGVPGGGETPGLMLGLAGIGALGLRLHDASSVSSPLVPGALLRGGKLTRSAEVGDRRVAPHADDARVVLESL
jgi:lantibiotic biosynthesis protein